MRRTEREREERNAIDGARGERTRNQWAREEAIGNKGTIKGETKTEKGGKEEEAIASGTC